jgi:hypothetical protein
MTRAKLKRRRLAACKEAATLKRQINRLRRAAKLHALLLRRDANMAWRYGSDYRKGIGFYWDTYRQMKSLKG